MNTNLEDTTDKSLAEMIHTHEATCPERPKGDDITIDETDVPIVPQPSAEQGAGT
jgi:hypothetical protein